MPKEVNHEDLDAAGVWSCIMASLRVGRARGAAGRKVHDVFADLGLPDAEALLKKTRLASKIDDAIMERGLSPAEASAIMGLTHESLSDLRNGRTKGYDVDHLGRLFNVLEAV
jgi:predicted XRE-type DNA-binding protein